MKQSKSKTNTFYALKLDMMKAYDRVEWDYLEVSMGKLGFANHWINVIMGMVRSVSFLYYSMAKSLKILNQQEESDKVILSHPIYFYCQ
jgi:hypothetical protein